MRCVLGLRDPDDWLLGFYNPTGLGPVWTEDFRPRSSLIAAAA
jgi:hypothetical protein